MSRFTEWSPELVAALAEPFPDEQKAEKKIQGRTITYVPWHHYVARLNALVGGGWSMGEPIVREVAEKLVIGTPVTILGVTRINFGDEEEEEYETVIDERTGEEKEKRAMYGSPCTNAFAQAFKRTCALFGMGLDMYEKKGGATSAGSDSNRKSAASDAKCPKCGGAVWDDRVGKKNPRSPDWKCKDKDGCGWAVWLDSARQKMREDLDALVQRGAIKPESVEHVMQGLKDGELDALRLAQDWIAEKGQAAA